MYFSGGKIHTLLQIPKQARGLARRTKRSPDCKGSRSGHPHAAWGAGTNCRSRLVCRLYFLLPLFSLPETLGFSQLSLTKCSFFTARPWSQRPLLWPLRSQWPPGVRLLETEQRHGLLLPPACRKPRAAAASFAAYDGAVMWNSDLFSEHIVSSSRATYWSAKYDTDKSLLEWIHKIV